MVKKDQKITLDAISQIVRAEVSGMKEDIVEIKKKVNNIDQRLKDFAEEYTQADLETRVVRVEKTLGIAASEDNDN